MQYSLTNADGVIVREASSEPVTYLHGTGALFSRLERELENHTVGDIVTAKLLPDDAFGKRNLELVHEAPLSDFPSDETIEVGGSVVGTDEEGGEVNFRITEISNDVALLDGNHPFAGQSLVFEIEIQAIRDASPEEIQQGKALP